MATSQLPSPSYLFKSMQYPVEPFLQKELFSYDTYKKYFVPIMQLNNSVIDVTIHLCWNDRENS